MKYTIFIIVCLVFTCVAFASGDEIQGSVSIAWRKFLPANPQHGFECYKDGNTIVLLGEGIFGVEYRLEKFDAEGNHIASYTNGISADSSGWRNTATHLKVNANGSISLFGLYTYYSSIPGFYRTEDGVPLRTEFSKELEKVSEHVSALKGLDRGGVGIGYKTTNTENMSFNHLVSETDVEIGLLTPSLDSIVDSQVFSPPVKCELQLGGAGALYVPELGFLYHRVVQPDESKWVYQSFMQYGKGVNLKVVELPLSYTSSLLPINAKSVYYTNSPQYTLGAYSMRLYKIAIDGTVQWQQDILPEKNWYGSLRCMTKDSGCILVGTCYSVKSSQREVVDTCRNSIIVKVAKDGKVEWSHISGFDGVGDHYSDAIEMDDGSVVAVGKRGNEFCLTKYVPSTIQSVVDWQAKQDGEIITNGDGISTLVTSQPDNPIQLNVFDALARRIYTTEGTTDAEGKIDLPLQQLQNGVYYVQWHSGKQSHSLPLLLSR